MFRSPNGVNVNPPAGFQHGWMQLGFQPSTVSGAVHTLVNSCTASAPLGEPFGSSGPATYVGLPVIGFAAQSFFNGTLNVDNSFVQSTYGGNFVQKGTRLIVTEAPIDDRRCAAVVMTQGGTSVPPCILSSAGRARANRSECGRRS